MCRVVAGAGLSLGRPGFLSRAALLSPSVNHSGAERRAPGKNSSVFLLVGEHQRIADAHAAPPRAQVDDLVAVVAFDAVD